MDKFAESGNETANLAMLMCFTKVKVNVSTVAIGNPERHVRKASHRGSKQQ